MTIILDGKELSKKCLAKLACEISGIEHKIHLVVIQVGDNPASTIYVGKKHKIANEIGIDSAIIKLSEKIDEEELLNIINKLNNNDETTGILVQLPLPKHIDENKIIDAIDYKKDVDGFSTYNAGMVAQGRTPFAYSCTPKGIIKLLKEYNIQIEGKNAVVVGRSNIVGKPIALMLLNENATVTICHSKTKNLGEITKTADILVTALGKPKFITKDMVKNGACVIDVGINRLENGKIVGDVDFENVKEIAQFITPVPGGVGPMTIAMLMENTFNLTKQKQ